MISRTARLLAGLMLLASVSDAGGPVYTRYGIGDILFFGSSRTWAMGGPGLALRGEGFINLANPAGLSGLMRTRFDASFGYAATWSEQGGSRSTFGLGGVQNVATAFPIDARHGIAMSIGITPYSSVGYSLRRSDDQSGVVSTQSFYGRGGLSSISLGLSASITQSSHVGLKAEYLYGRIRQYSTIDFQNASFVDDFIDRSGFYQGFQITAGTILDVNSVLPDVPVSIALTATLPSTAGVEQNDSFSALDTVLQSTGDATLPFRLGAGAYARIGERINAIADVVYERWSGATLFGAAQTELRNSLRISAGMELLPRAGDVPYLQRIGYRLGVGYAQTYVQLNGTGIDDVFATAGFSFPVGPDARLNTGFQVGTRGTTAAGLQKDTYVKFSLGFSASELWFFEIEED